MWNVNAASVTTTDWGMEGRRSFCEASANDRHVRTPAIQSGSRAFDFDRDLRPNEAWGRPIRPRVVRFELFRLAVRQQHGEAHQEHHARGQMEDYGLHGLLH
jgi:hypothetical protein